MTSRMLKYILFALALISIGLMAGFNMQPGSRSVSQADGINKLSEAIAFIQQNYVEEVDVNQLTDQAIQGILESLDPHSFYISAEEMKITHEQMTGSFDGIGVEFSILEDTIYVVAPLSGGPSEKLGILAGDRIIKVDGKNVAGVRITNTEVMKSLKGPKGTTVTVSILRRGVVDPITFNIVRDKIPVHSVGFAYMMTKDIGYIQVTRFAETTYDEFAAALEKLKSEGMKNLVLDLRGNPGGYMNMAYKIADEFLPGGKLIVSTRGRRPDSKNEYVATSTIDGFTQGGLVVLIDYGSASASEIVSGAVQDHDRGLILGIRSYGKGLVQTQHDFADGSAMRVVISSYYTPSGRCIQKPYDKPSDEYEHEISERFERGEIYDESKINFPDSLKYQTAAGRTVYGGGGIYPDVFVAPDSTGGSKYLTDLTIKDLLRGFAYQYVDEQPGKFAPYNQAKQFVQQFQIDQSILDAFKQYAEAHGVPYSAAGWTRSARIIENRLKAYMGRKLFQDDGFFPVFHQIDNTLQKAVTLMPQALEMAQGKKKK